ncbi:MAG: hypothetical protein GKS00_22135 [Alphaproteobacteria bacterium]|nr:hypothetical protein [Alphaproteobacteria bacterium]
MTLIEQISEVMSDHRGPAHVNDIAEMLLVRYPNISTLAAKLPDKISAVLSANARKTAGKAQFAKVKNKTGGFKRGLYRLKNKPVVTPAPTLAPAVTTQYTGKAGECAVISELLFYGFNASAMAVDDGIDVVASKDNKYFHIQVKTSNSTENAGFSFTIKKSTFTAKDSFQTFYIFVIREKGEHRYFNDYIILPSNQIRQYIEVGIIKDGQSLSIRVQKDSRGRYILNAKQDVTISVNTFSQLA